MPSALTPAEVDALLPNGFHDAVLRELHVELARQEVRLVLEFWVGDLGAETEERREATRAGTLRLPGVTSIRIDPPDPSYAFVRSGGVTVDGDFGA